MPINRIVNSKRILETGKYQLTRFGSRYKYQENCWLIKYLFDQGKTKTEIEEIFRPIYEQEYTKLSPKLFMNFCRAAMKNDLKKYSNQIVIYESELFWINHLPLVLSQKQFALLMLCYFKVLNNKECEFSEFMDWEMKAFIKRPDRHEKYDFSNVVCYLKDAGYLISRQKEVYDPYFDEYDSYEKIKFKSVGPKSEEDNPVLVLESIIDLMDNLDIVKNKKICEQCGVDFECSSRNQRNICDTCWKKERYHKQYLSHKHSIDNSKPTIYTMVKEENKNKTV